MDEYATLHKALSEAEVEHQQAFDALKRFYDGLRMPNSITDLARTLAEEERLEAAERRAYEKRKAASNAFREHVGRER